MLEAYLTVPSDSGQLTHEVEAMKPDLPYGVDAERRWLVERSRAVLEQCRKMVEDMKGS